MYVMLDDFHERAARRSCRPTRSPPRCKPSCRTRSRDGVVNVFGAPPVDGLGTAGGFKIMIEDRGDNGLDALQAVADDIVADGQRHARPAAICSPASAPTRPGCTSTSTAPQAKTMGVSMTEVFNTLQVYLGSLYVNDFNRFGRTWQVNVQADAELPQADRRPEAAAKSATTTGRWCRWARSPRCSDVSGPVMIIRYNMYPSAPINGSAGPGDQLRPGDRADGERRREQARPGRCAPSGPSWPCCNCRPATRRCSSSCWPWCWCSWCWPRSTKAGRCRWP